MTKEVIVTGAGFSRAFYPKAPLLRMPIGDELEGACKHLPLAVQTIRAVRNRDPERFVDVEGLLTRVTGGMPYDSKSELPELQILKREVLKRLLEAIRDARKGQAFQQDLQRFARACLDSRTTCITFNYDDFLDEQLNQLGIDRWHPERGYGFLMRNGIDLVSTSTADRETRMHILKLHGSVNWRIRLGTARPLSVEQVFCSTWGENNWEVSLAQVIEDTLEPEPLIVPPILIKGELVQEPVLRLVWRRAFEVLKQSSKVTFVGYSLPLTDISSRFLFSEALSAHDPSQIFVVNRPEKGKEGLVRDAYLTLCSGIPNSNFEFRDARDWCNEFSSKQVAV